ncbi:MAG: amidohydrolase family protein [Vicinamibacterales bacterium]
MRRMRQVIVLAAAVAVCWAFVGVTTRTTVAQPAQPPMKATLAVVGGFLIDGFGGPPKPNAVVLVEGDTIVAVGEEGRLAVPPGAKVVDANGFTVMPGLIDTHVHLDIIGHGIYAQWHRMVRNEYAQVMRLAAAQLIAHGITTALDAGGDTRVSVETRDRINRGEMKGPRMLVSGGWIQKSSDEAVKRHHRASQISNAQTPEEAREATRRLLDAGVDAIKVYTGLSADQIRAISDEAHQRRKLVGAHVYGDAEIQNAITGGVDILHHAGSGHQNPLYSTDTLRMMAARQIPVGQSIAHRVTLYPAHMSWPERLDDPRLRRELGKYADQIMASLRDFTGLGYFGRIQLQTRVAPAATRQLYEAGVRMIMGTDSGTPGNFHSESVWREMEALVRMTGMTPSEVIGATTKDAAAALRVNTGVITPGRLADIILVKGNPLESMLYLQNVAVVIKDGAVQTPMGSSTNNE